MGDEWFPSATPMLSPWIANLVDNATMVQFVHRWLAFIVAAFVALLAAAAWRAGRQPYAIALVAAVAVQILLGIFTLLSGMDIVVAAGHQGMAVVLLGTILAASHKLGRRSG